MTRIRVGWPQFFPQLYGGAKQRVIEEVPADRQVALDRNAHRLQFVGGADARTQQYCGAMDGASTQHDLARTDFRAALPFDVNQYAGGSALPDQEAINQRTTADLQICAAPRRLQIRFI